MFKIIIPKSLTTLIHLGLAIIFHQVNEVVGEIIPMVPY